MSKTIIQKWKCPTCGKELQSLYETQLDQWRDSHLRTHEEKR
jgi:transposase-like protein